MKFLRAFRIAFALAFFVLISLQFFDIYHTLPKLYYMYPPAGVQFVPSLLNMLAATGVVAAWWCVVFIALTLILGRVYCSFICPMGILMDILRKIAKYPAQNKILKKTAVGKFAAKHFLNLKYSKGLTFLRVAFLALAVVFIALGLGALLGLFEPYSLYGKIMSGAFIVSSEGVNYASAELADWGYYGITPATNAAFSAQTLGFSVLLLVLFAVVSAIQGRLFCNTICPVGAFLGGLAKISIFGLTLDKSECVSCGKCEKTCKAKCINSKAKTLDFSRCVLCFDCASSCPKKAIKFELNPLYKKIFSANKCCASACQGECNCNQEGNDAKNCSCAATESAKDKCDCKKSAGKNITRKEFGAAIFAASGALVAESKKDEDLAKKHSLKVLDGASEYTLKGERFDKRLPSPPGSKSIENFLENCTACQRCVDSCKSQVLKASIGQWGLSHFMQPFMDFKGGFCLPDCHNCSKACPTGAIRFIGGKEKMGEKIGTAIFNQKLCVVYTDGTDCAACAEHCPVQAIEMVPFDEKKSLYIPHVHEEVCIGCGACEYICPVRPHTAIVIQGLKKHIRAKPFNENMRLFVPQEAKKDAKPLAPKPNDNPFPF